MTSLPKEFYSMHMMFHHNFHKPYEKYLFTSLSFVCFSDLQLKRKRKK